MPALRDILDRFRPAPGPGRPGSVGVPSHATHTAADELRPVFAALDDVAAQCTLIRDEGDRRADQIRRAANAEIATIRSQVASTADHVRALSAASVQAAGEIRQAAELTAARHEAEQIRADGLAKMAPYVAAAVVRVRDLAGSQGAARTSGAS